MDIIKTSFLTRLVIFIFDIFSLSVLILGNIFRLNSLFINLFLLILIITLTFYLFFLNVIYILDNNKIVKKYPFINPKEYDVNDVIGIELTKNHEDEAIILYFEKISIKINAAETIYKERLLKYYRQYYQSIKNKIIDKINTIGYNIKTLENNLIFYNNRVEMTGKNKISYFYDKDIKNIKEIKSVDKYVFSSRLDLITKGNETIILNADECKGGIGLFDFLKQRIKVSQ